MYTCKCCWVHLIGLCFTYALAVSVTLPDKECFLSSEEGHCQEQILRWFYNSKSGHCETFIYSGCGGNGNNFNSTMYCLLSCNGTEADNHPHSTAVAATADDIEQGRSGDEKNDEDNQSTKKSPSSKQVIQSRRSSDHEKTKKSLRTSNDKGVKDEAKDAHEVQEVLSQLSHSVNMLERIVQDRVGKRPRKPQGKKHRRLKSSRPHASVDILGSDASDEKGKRRSLKAIEMNNHSDYPKTNDVEDDGTDFNAEERNVLDVKIRSIISDPSFVFSCRNISARDMSVLKEVMFEMDTKALRFVTPSPMHAEDKVDGGDGSDKTTALQATTGDQKNQMVEELPVIGV